MDLADASIVLLILSVLFGIYGIVYVSQAFLPGIRRSVAYAVLSGVFLAPTVLAGHGIAIVPALAAVLTPMTDGTWEPHGMMWGLVPMGVVAVLVFLATAILGPTNHDSAESISGENAQRTRKEKMLLLILLCGVVLVGASEFAYRSYWVAFKATYGPFIVNVNAGRPTLRDIAALLQCESSPGSWANRSKAYVHRQAIASGVPTAFPAKYMGLVTLPLHCELALNHPEFRQGFAIHYVLPNVKPRDQIELQAQALP